MQDRVRCGDGDQRSWRSSWFLSRLRVFLSGTDAYNWVNQSQVSVPIEQAVNYAVQDLAGNQSVAVVCPLNRFNQYMIRYYLNVKDPSFEFSKAWQYPAEAVDAYTPVFNISEFALLCEQHDAKYVLLYESSKKTYFNTNLTAQTICGILMRRLGLGCRKLLVPSQSVFLFFRSRN